MSKPTLTRIKPYVQGPGPAGGVMVSEKTCRKWAWTSSKPIASEPLRCKSEQWYLVRAALPTDQPLEATVITIICLTKEAVPSPQVVPLYRPVDDRWPNELLGWFKTPEDAHELCAVLTDNRPGVHFERLELHPVAEMDPKCHPLAHLPSWSTYRPPFEISRVILPTSLELLVEDLGDLEVTLAEPPSSLSQLKELCHHAAVILDPDWITRLELTADALDELARNAWVIIDLQSLADVLHTSGRCDARIKTRTSPHDIMSARNVYADVPTRGLAMQDAVPFSYRDEKGRFALRVLLNNRAWKKYADQVGFATLYQSETETDDKSGDVVMAACPVGNGELIVTDVPWLVAGDFGPLLARRLAEHMLRMTCGAPLSDSVAFWHHWDDTGVILRDIADLPRRYTGFRTMRWASEDPALAQLGLSLAGENPRRHLVIQTGRIDHAGEHDGIPAEAMVAYMKFLEREMREETTWAQHFLDGWRITWQFESARGLRHVVEYDSAKGIRPEQPTTYLAVRSRAESDGSDAQERDIELPLGQGLLGDGSLAAQEVLAQRLCDVIEQLQR